MDKYPSLEIGKSLSIYYPPGFCGVLKMPSKRYDA
jgi:hypothetical protein